MILFGMSVFTFYGGKLLVARMILNSFWHSRLNLNGILFNFRVVVVNIFDMIASLRCGVDTFFQLRIALS